MTNPLNMKVRDLSREERIAALQIKIDKFLQTLSRRDRQIAKKHMKKGMSLEEALRTMGWTINKK